MKILAADIGGTKSWLCLSETDSNTAPKDQKVIYEQVYASADFSDFSTLLKHFLEAAKLESNATIETMCLALPGVIKQGRSSLTNLDWQLDEKQLAKEFSIAKVGFVNDFQAAAMGVTTLDKSDYLVLNSAPTNPQAITVVTGAGTGLGLAWMDNKDEHLQLFDTEGGHCDFAPTNDQQIELLKYLQKQFSHVSYERILSGNGLVQLYQFLNQHDQTVMSMMDSTTASEVTQLALQKVPLAEQAIRLFVEIYAAYIGNLALLYNPAGGIYIAGGVATHILPWMRGEVFINSYLDKGRMRDIAAQTAVYLVTNTRLGLQGAIKLAQ